MTSRISGTVNEAGYTIVENALLEGRNTFRITARAELMIDVVRSESLSELFAYPMLKASPPLILGGGSNILFTRDWPGVIVSISATGIRIVENRGDVALVRAEAGENWNDLVQWSLAHGFVGLENLALIPGTVGASPIQNIGAYGTEVREFVETVEAFDRSNGTMVRLSNAQCEFAYRDSIFKHHPDRYLVTAVEFLLSRTRELRLDYVGVREELAAMKINVPTAPAVAEAVCRLRTRKLPNPALIGNAGSFFKNPVVSSTLAEELKHDHPTLPVWPAGSDRKLSAAWLIQACGLKGLREGDAGVSEQHALVLVNHGRATGAQVWHLAQHVIETVEGRFSVRLEPEPIVV